MNQIMAEVVEGCDSKHATAVTGESWQLTPGVAEDQTQCEYRQTGIAVPRVECLDFSVLSCCTGVT